MSDDSKPPIPLKYYRDLIRNMVGTRIASAYYLKPLPLVYFDGTDDRVAFENWLYALLLYFRVSMMCEEPYDDVRVTTAAGYMKGVAKDWFFARVATPGSSIPYKFEEVVIEMAQVFITFGPSAPPKYIPGTTPAAFHFQLEHWYEMTVGGSKKRRDFRVKNQFLLGMREAMQEMHPSESELIGDWFDTSYDDDDAIPKEVLLGRTRRVLDRLEERKNQGWSLG